MKEVRKITIVETDYKSTINTELTVCNGTHTEALYMLINAANKIIEQFPEYRQDEVVELCVASLLFD